MQRKRLETLVLATFCQHPSLYPSGLEDYFFSTKEGQAVFRELERFRGHESVDELTVCGTAGASNHLAKELQEVQVKSLIQGSKYCRQLRERVDFECMLQEVREFAEGAYKDEHPMQYFATRCESAISKVRTESSLEPLSFRELIRQGLEEQKQIIERGISPSYSTGVRVLDKKIGGFRSGELIVLAAEAGAGKSTLALWMARHVAAEHGKVLFLSAEMTDHQISERGAKAQLGIPLIGKDTTVEDIERELERLKNNTTLDNIKFEFAPRYTQSDVMHLGRAMNKKDELKLIIFDHLRRWVPARPSDNPYNNISAAIEEAKETAKILNVPVLMLTHLSRRRDHVDVPTMTLIRDSGKVEDEADSIIIAWPKKNRDGSRSNEMDLHVLKARQGSSLGPVTVYFDPSTQGYIEDVM